MSTLASTLVAHTIQIASNRGRLIGRRRTAPAYRRVPKARVFERDKGWWPDPKGFGMFLLNFIKKIIFRRKRRDLKPSWASRKGRFSKDDALKTKQTDHLPGADSNWFASNRPGSFAGVFRRKPHWEAD